MYTSAQFLEKHRTGLGKAAGVGWTIVRAFLVIGLSFILLYPLLYMISMAFRPVEQAYDPAVFWIPKSLTLENFKTAIYYMDYWTSIGNTLAVNVVSAMLQVIVCVFTGYGFARFNFKGKGLLFGLAVFTILLPPQVIIIPMSSSLAYFDFFGLGNIGRLFGSKWTVNLLDTVLSFYLPAAFGAGIKSGLFVFIFRQFFRNLPKELEDAAAIDGCGFFQTFIRVIVPNAIAVAITAVLLSLVWYWNDYYYSSIWLTNTRPISLALSNLSGAFGMDTQNHDPYAVITLMQAGALITIAPILVVFIALQRFFVQGVERVGIVG